MKCTFQTVVLYKIFSELAVNLKNCLSNSIGSTVLPLLTHCIKKGWEDFNGCGKFVCIAKYSSNLNSVLNWY